VEVRDREVIIDLPQSSGDGRVPESELKSWISEVVKATFSSAFNSYSRNEMTFEQTKIYCSENVFKNIARLSTQYRLSESEMEAVDKHIKKGVLEYLAAKYPLSDSSVVNKKMEEAVKEVDNIEALSNNYFTTSSIVFEYRESGNYNDLIMLMLNDLISKVDESQEQTSFRGFEAYMSDLFEKVEDEDWIKHQEREQINLQLGLSMAAVNLELATN
jgi:hypothetical protein